MQAKEVACTKGYKQHDNEISLLEKKITQLQEELQMSELVEAAVNADLIRLGYGVNEVDSAASGGTPSTNDQASNTTSPPVLRVGMLVPDKSENPIVYIGESDHRTQVIFVNGSVIDVVENDMIPDDVVIVDPAPKQVLSGDAPLKNNKTSLDLYKFIYGDLAKQNILDKVSGFIKKTKPNKTAVAWHKYPDKGYVIHVVEPNGSHLDPETFKEKLTAAYKIVICKAQQIQKKNDISKITLCLPPISAGVFGTSANDRYAITANALINAINAANIKNDVIIRLYINDEKERNEYVKPFKEDVGKAEAAIEETAATEATEAVAANKNEEAVSKQGPSKTADMFVKVTVPDGMVPGDVLQVEAYGQARYVEVPDWVGPGQQFKVNMAQPQPAAAAKRAARAAAKRAAMHTMRMVERADSMAEVADSWANLAAEKRAVKMAEAAAEAKRLLKSVNDSDIRSKRPLLVEESLKLIDKEDVRTCINTCEQLTLELFELNKQITGLSGQIKDSIARKEILNQSTLNTLKDALSRRETAVSKALECLEPCKLLTSSDDDDDNPTKTEMETDVSPPPSSDPPLVLEMPG